MKKMCGKVNGKMILKNNKLNSPVIVFAHYFNIIFVQ